MKSLAELQAECLALGIRVSTGNRASKEPFVAALREYHWRRDHPHEPVPEQVSPMLLASWVDLDDVEAEEIEQDCHAWIVQPKLDGVRALLHVEDGRVRITSRCTSVVTYRLSELEAHLPHLTIASPEPGGTILDGELVCPAAAIDTGHTITGTTLQATTAILASSPEEAARIQDRQHARIRFHAFDILRHRDRDLTGQPLVGRQEHLAEAVRGARNPYLALVPSFSVGKGDIHRRFLAAGGEGTVWKRVDQPYEPGRRVWHWIKRKQEVEVEAVVSGFKPGTNGHAGMVGALEFSAVDRKGERRPIAWVSTWSNDDRRRMTNPGQGTVALAPGWMGRKAVIAGQDFAAKSGRVRHARLVRWLWAASL